MIKEKMRSSIYLFLVLTISSCSREECITSIYKIDSDTKPANLLCFGFKLREIPERNSAPTKYYGYAKKGLNATVFFNKEQENIMSLTIFMDTITWNRLDKHFPQKDQVRIEGTSFRYSLPEKKEDLLKQRYIKPNGDTVNNYTEGKTKTVTLFKNW